MQYGQHIAPAAHDAYIAKQADEYNKTVFVSKTELHIDCFIRNIIYVWDICIVANFTIGQLVGNFTKWLGLWL